MEGIMSATLLDDVKADRISFTVDSLTPSRAGVTDLRVVRIGTPEVEDTRMCAQCVGECKVF
ncbi:hypothetical protein HMPREF3086_01490 [Dietzia sp. HMSC21D01]|jgi:hypothetical protein|nr:hypothetical protein HMPREF3086_01490 [Dietzia sp. HMSC21D01]